LYRYLVPGIDFRQAVFGQAVETSMELDNPVAISALQHAVYCLRQAALIHIERIWAENRFTAEGRVLHEVAHEAGSRKSRACAGQRAALFCVGQN